LLSEHARLPDQVLHHTSPWQSQASAHLHVTDHGELTCMSRITADCNPNPNSNPNINHNPNPIRNPSPIANPNPNNNRQGPWIALDQVAAGAEAGAKMSPQAAEYPSSRVAMTHGRPKWERIFASIAAAHPRQRVGVFVCGPKVQAGKQNTDPHPHPKP